ncbi:MAG: hypothetical protein JRI97_05520, partial [Deltaproteobacteria bacterium]|nr:hypothetical protein [Deltaproteobacteria bacterium]
MPRILPICLGFALAAVLCGPAQAYVLPAEQILGFSVTAMGDPGRLSTTEALVLYPEKPAARRPEAILLETFPEVVGPYSSAYKAGEPEACTCTVHASWRPPDSFREQVDCPETDRLFVVSGGEAAWFSEGRLMDTTEGPLDAFKDLLLVRDAELLADKLYFSGVDLSVTSLGMWEGVVVWVVGAQYPDESVPQVWVERKSRLPVRYIITRAAARGRRGLEVRYRDWVNLRTPRRPVMFPQTIRFYENGRLVR